MNRQLSSRLRAFGSAVLLIGAGCADVEGESNAPPEAFYYPTGLTVLPALTGAPGRQFALVGSSNFDLRFSAGWVSLVDVDALFTAGEPADAIVDQVRLPSFGGPIAVARLGESERTLAVLGHRGAQTLSVIEITSEGGTPRLSCGDPDATADLSTLERRTDCDRRHLYVLDDDNLADFPATLDADDFTDPYAVAFVPRVETGELLLVVGFLSHALDSSSRLLVFLVNPDAGPGEAFLVPERVLVAGQSGIGDLVARPIPASCGADASAPECMPFVAGTSRYYGSASERSVVFGVSLDPDQIRLAARSITDEVDGAELGGMVFAADGDTAYVTNNGPDSVVVLDSRLVSTPRTGDPTSYYLEPTYAFRGALSLSGRPAGLAYLDRSDTDLLAVAVFTEDDLALLSVAGGTLVSTHRVYNVGSGPSVLAGVREASGDDLVLVGTFFNHGLTAVRVPADNVLGAAVVARVRDPELGDASE